MPSGQWGRTMVTIDGCKLLVDHGEAHGVGVTKLSEGLSPSTLPTPPANMAERGLGLGTGVTADIDIGGVAARAALLRRYAHPST